ncbi:MAG: spore coat protein U domain-containing protein [Alphaproteobacteria bacterium]|jgi:spore coat protein U-like protein|nr:spore coat protein U domain-containing protein [Alphaproteobacteria bacterium]MBT5390028.1 spore coat protein U domain-containing protein [Alphaproteobacteria bacterium]MBT5540905.1 spore coat protein U domain-containing protein [Alphaproteobacteria bacterium]MBT5654205.1 spore coat protein U domain-containing protein [Alphaproteobacteria bacterium]
MKIAISKATAVAFGLFYATGAFAGSSGGEDAGDSGESDRTTFQVSASVAESCQVTANDLSFGSYDPIGVNATNNLNSSSNIQLTCTVGTTYDVGLNQGTTSGGTTTTRKMKAANGSDTLNYKLFQNSSRSINWGNSPGSDTKSGTSSGTNETITVYGAVLSGQVIDNDTYSDVITVTVTY